MRNSEKNTTFAPAKSLKGLSTVDFGALDERFSLRSAKPARAVRLRHAPQKQRDSIESLFSLTISLRLTLLLMLSLSSFVIIAGCPAALRYFLRCGHLRLNLTVCLLCRIACCRETVYIQMTLYCCLLFFRQVVVCHIRTSDIILLYDILP